VHRANSTLAAVATVFVSGISPRLQFLHLASCECYSPHVETDGGNGGNDLAKLELNMVVLPTVSRLTMRMHISRLKKGFWKCFGKGEPHGSSTLR
jgi:hypothetical protein